MTSFSLHQALLVAFAIFVPAVLLWKNSARWVIAYFCLVSHLDILSAARGESNLTFLKFFSIVSVPFAIKKLMDSWPEHKGDKAFQSIFAFVIYVILSATAFGVLFPWPDTAGSRALYDQSLFRSLRQLITVTSEISLAYILAFYIKEVGSRNTLRLLTLVCSVCAVGALAEQILNFDFYAWLSEGRAFLEPYRARGLSYEPRGLANVAALGTLYAFLSLRSLSAFAAAAALFAVTNYLATSMVGNVLFLAVALFMVIIALLPVRTNYRAIAKALIFIPILIASLTFDTVVTGTVFAENLGLTERIAFRKSHFSNRGYIYGEKNDGLMKFVSKFEVHDAAALNFLLNNPGYALTGAGIGTMGIASSPYILPRDQAVWKNRADNNPHMGGVFLLGQYGLIGSAFLLLAFILLLKRAQIEDAIAASGILVIWLLQMRYGLVLIFALLLQYLYRNDRQDRNA